MKKLLALALCPLSLAMAGKYDAEDRQEFIFAVEVPVVCEIQEPSTGFRLNEPVAIGVNYNSEKAIIKANSVRITGNKMTDFDAEDMFHVDFSRTDDNGVITMSDPNVEMTVTMQNDKAVSLTAGEYSLAVTVELDCLTPYEYNN